MENEQSQNENQIDLVLLLHDMIRGMLKFWWLLLILVIGGAAISLGWQYKNYVPMYQSKASFTVAMENTYESGYSYLFYYDRSTAAQMASTFPYILQSELLTDLVKQDLDVDYINGSISASAIDNSNLFTLSVISSSPQDAKTILDSVIKNYPTVSQYVIGNTQLNMIEASQVPDEPYNHIARRNYAMKGAMLGGIIWLGLMLLYAYFRETIKSEDQIRSKLNAVSLGTIPQVQFKKRNSANNQEISIRNRRIGQDFAESIRKVALRVSKTLKEQNGHILSLSGADDGEGCSITTLNLAYAFAEMSQKVLLIAQEKETQSEAYLFLRDIKAEIGKVQEVNGIGFCILPNHFKALSAKLDVEHFLKDMEKEYDVIVIDAGKGSVTSEAASVIQFSDCFLLVVRQDYTPYKKIADCISNLATFDCTFAGCVLNGVTGGILGYGYGKYGGYHYSSYSRYGRYGRYGKYGSYGKKYGYGSHSYGYGYGYGESPLNDTDGKAND